MNNFIFKNRLCLVFFGFLGMLSSAQNITNYYPSDGLIEGGIYTIEQDHNGHMWYGSWTNPEGSSGLSKFDGTSWEQYTAIDDGLVGDHIRVVFEDKDNNLWIGTTTGISMYDGSSITNYTTGNGLVHDYVFTIIQDTDGDIWVGTNGGVSRFDGENWTNYTESNNEGINWVYSIIQDNAGNMWFGSGGKGVTKFDVDGNTWTNYNKDNSGLPANDIWVVLQDKNGDFWFATYFGAGLSKFDGISSWTTYTESDGLPNVKIRALAEDSYGDLWIGSNAGATRFNGYNLTSYTQAEGLIPGGVRSFHQDNNGDLWVGTWSSGVSKIETSIVNIPDDSFEQVLIETGIDVSGLYDNKISRLDAKNADSINANFPMIPDIVNGGLKPNSFAHPNVTIITEIADLSGIEFFDNITKLGVGYNNLTSINVSSLGKLDDFFPNDNQLTSIDVSNNRLLKRFGPMRNPGISSIDVSENLLLEDFFMDGTACLSIDLSNNPNLKRFYGRWGSLNGIDLSNNPLVYDIKVRGSVDMRYMNVKNGNNLYVTGFDVRNMPDLPCITADGTTNAEVSDLMLSFSYGLLSEDCGTVYIPDANFELALINQGVDIAGNQDHLILKTEAVAQTSLNVGSSLITDITGIEAFTSLTELAIYDNQITEIDLTNNVLLEGLYFNDNKISNLDLTNQYNLSFLNIDRNNTEKLILGNHPNLSVILGSGNTLNSIDVNNCPSLVTLSLGGSRLTNLDLTGNEFLEEIVVHWNLLTELDISANPNVSFLLCEGNQLTSLNIANGNNSNFIKPVSATYTDYAFNAQSNNNLECIQVDVDMPYNIPSDWGKNENSFYSENCSEIETGWGIVGSATQGGWVGPDTVFNTTDIGNVFEAYITLKDGHIKFRKNEDWSFNFGDNEPDGILDGPPNSADIPVSAGAYKIVLDLNNQTYTISPDDRTLGIVGSATPNSWNGPDMVMSYNPDTVKWTANVTLTDAEIKFRFDNDWTVNFGDNGNDGTLERNSANIPVVAGDYFVKVDLFAMTYTLESKYVNIPNANFEKSLIDIGIDSDGVVNQLILRSDAEAVTDLNLNNPAETPNGYAFDNPLITYGEGKIGDLTGIEAFTALTHLQLSYSGVTTVDVSNNVLLEELWITDGILSEIDVTTNTNLVRLGVMRNAIGGTIDLSQNLNLEWFLAYNNSLTSLDVSGNPNLTTLRVNNNAIPELNISLNPNLERLDAQYNVGLNLISNGEIYLSLTSLNLSGIGLRGYNALQTPNIQWLLLSDNQLNQLNLSNTTSLQNLYVNDNAMLEHLDMRNGNNEFVTRFFVSGTALSCINADAIISTAMTQEGIDSVKTFSVDCGDFVYIEDENFEQSLLDIINPVSGYRIDTDGFVNHSILRKDAEAVIDLNLNNPNFTPENYNFKNDEIINVMGQIEDLTGIEAFKYLTKLQVSYSNLETIDVTSNSLLEELWVADGILTSFDVSSNAALLKLGVMRNDISGTVDISGNPNLTQFFAHENRISGIISTPSPNLTRLAVQGNDLELLDLINYPGLSFVSAGRNSLLALDISTNTVIDRVDAQDNVGLVLTTDVTLGSPTLRSLNLSGTGLGNYNGVAYPNIEWLLLYNNNLTKFNGNNTLLVQHLFLQNNQIGSLNIAPNAGLIELNANSNLLTDLDLRNNNNPTLTTVDVTSNLLTCISVDDPVLAITYPNWLIDPGVNFSANCKAEPDVVLIPDVEFERALGIELDTNGENGNILLSDALAIIDLDLSASALISNLTGIEAFENLLTLNVSGNQLSNLIFTSVDYNGPTNLIELNVSGNNLSILNVPSGRSLEMLNASSNEFLNDVNLADLTDITELNLSGTSMTSINLNNHSGVLNVNVSNNPLLTELSIINGNNTLIQSFDARENPILECIGVDDPDFSGGSIDWDEGPFQGPNPELYTSTGDCIAPVIITQNIEVELDRNGLASITAADVDGGSYDNTTTSGKLIMTISQVDFDCSSLGTNTIILTVADEFGNEDSAEVAVTIVDVESPSAKAVRSYSAEIVGGSITLIPSLLDDGSTDNCSIDSFGLSQTYFTIAGTYYLDFTVTDTNGNISMDQVEVEITESAGTKELKFGGITVIVSPNPFVNIINLAFSKPTDFNNVSVGLTDISGNMVTYNLSEPDTQHLELSGLDSYGSGSYILTITVGNKTQTAILVKS